jgi:hypothetical protein
MLAPAPVRVRAPAGTSTSTSHGRGPLGRLAAAIYGQAPTAGITFERSQLVAHAVGS